MINLDSAFFSSSAATPGRAQPDGDFVSLFAHVSDRTHPDAGQAGDLVSEAADVLDGEALEGAAAALAQLAEESGASLDDDVVAPGAALWLLHNARWTEHGDGPEAAAEASGESTAAPVAEVERASLADAEGAPADDETAAVDDERVPTAGAESAPAGGDGESTEVAAGSEAATPAPVPDGVPAGVGKADAPADDDTDAGPLHQDQRGATRRSAATGAGRPAVAGAAESARSHRPAEDAERVEEAQRVERAEARVARGIGSEATTRPEARPATPTGERVTAEQVFVTATEAATARAAEVSETATPRAPGATMVERILEAATRLENQPPPRQLTLELGEARVRLAIEDGALRVQLLGEQRAEDRELLRAAAAELRARGFELGGDGPGREREGRPETPDGPPARSGGHGPAGPRHRAAATTSPTSTDLRL